MILPTIIFASKGHIGTHLKNKKTKTTGLKISGKDNLFVNCGVDGFDNGIKITKTAKGNKLIGTDINLSPTVLPKAVWYKKPIGIIFLTIISGLIVAILINYFGLN